MSKLVIVGNGVAGVTAARAARRRDARLDITLLAAEATPYYSRPGLHYVLTGLTRPEDLHPLPASYWDTNRIRVVHAEAHQIEAGAVVLTDGRRIPFDRCVLATGSRPRDLAGAAEVMAAGLACRLHRKEDIEAINYVLTTQREVQPTPEMQPPDRATAAPQPRAIVLGAGLTGLELAELCVQRGYRTDVFFPELDPQQAILDDVERTWLLARMTAHGVSFFRGESAQSIRMTPGPFPAGAEVLFTSGRTEQAHVVALALGVEPCVAIAQRSGIATSRGITVGPDFQTTQSGVFAIGDVAEMDGRISTLWYTARQQAMQMVDGWYGAKLVAGADPREAYNSAQFFGIDYHFWGDTSLLPGSAQDIHFVSASGNRAERRGKVANRFWSGKRPMVAPKGTDAPENPSATRMVRLIGFDGKLGAVSALGYRLRGDAVRADLGRPLVTIDPHRISTWGFEPEFTQTSWIRTEVRA
ncbi:MAG: hypothetical protein EB075_04985 [Bacteroidetes bacterium]|nr:hypothetical protein [Bacteroidota bacterium]